MTGAVWVLQGRAGSGGNRYAAGAVLEMAGGRCWQVGRAVSRLWRQREQG